MAGKVCPECGKGFPKGRRIYAEGFYTGRKVRVCSCKCLYYYDDKLHHEESTSPKFADAREQAANRETYRSERQAEFDAGII